MELADKPTDLSSTLDWQTGRWWGWSDNGQSNSWPCTLHLASTHSPHPTGCPCLHTHKHIQFPQAPPFAHSHSSLHSLQHVNTHEVLIWSENTDLHKFMHCLLWNQTSLILRSFKRAMKHLPWACMFLVLPYNQSRSCFRVWTWVATVCGSFKTQFFMLSNVDDDVDCFAKEQF